ncbi:MAG: type III pantothenate kinase [PVC group bacterium]|nr:type III pantothenate kinase [PVC group bacterium]
MLLVIDIGNTSITFGLKRNKKSFTVWRLPTKQICKPAIFKKFISEQSNKFRFKLSQIDHIVICSVVPSIDHILKKQLKKNFSSAKIAVLGKDINIPIKNKYTYPEQVGKDRLANALAAKQLYGLPAIIVDFGTAITVDVVSGKGEYLGGVITPGITISLNALYEKTDLLPLVNSKKPRQILGKTTSNSVRSGIFYGFGYLVDGIISALKKEISGAPVVLGTGGGLALVRPFCKKIDKYDAMLTLHGIEIAFNLSNLNEKGHNKAKKSKK